MSIQHPTSNPQLNLPQDSKIWIFQSSRNFSEAEITDIEKTLDNFMLEWNAHGAALTSAYAIPYDRFIVIAVDENKAQASGCSIDSMTRQIKSLEEKHNFGLLNRMLISYKVGEEIFTLPLNEFKQMVKQNQIPEEASVFHNGITKLSDFEESWESSLNESWVKPLLQLGVN